MTFSYGELLAQLDKARCEMAAIRKLLRESDQDPQACLTCGGTKGYCISYGEGAGWRECSSCDGTGVRRTASPPPTPKPDTTESER